MGEHSWMAEIAAGLTVLVTYTLLVARQIHLERDVKDLKEWSEAIDPKKQRHTRRDSDVIRFRDAKDKGASA